jgi:hypothetical protein
MESAEGFVAASEQDCPHDCRLVFMTHRAGDWCSVGKVVDGWEVTHIVPSDVPLIGDGFQQHLVAVWARRMPDTVIAALDPEPAPS